MLERSRANDAVKELEAIFKTFLDTSVFRSIERIEEVRGQGIRSSILFMRLIHIRTLLKALKLPTEGKQMARKLGGEANNGYLVKNDGSYNPQVTVVITRS